MSDSSYDLLFKGECLPDVDPAEVRITLRVDFANARIPNLLGTFGVDLSAKYFELSSASRRDCR